MASALQFPLLTVFLPHREHFIIYYPQRLSRVSALFNGGVTNHRTCKWKLIKFPTLTTASEVLKILLYDFQTFASSFLAYIFGSYRSNMEKFSTHVVVAIIL